MAGEKIYDQIRACGIFFISIVILLIVPLVYHCFVFLIAVPLLEVQPFSAWCLLISFHILLGMVLICYHRVIFTDAGGVPYELDEAWISELSLASRFGLEAGLADQRVMISDKNSEKNPLTGLGQERKGDGRQRFCRKCHKFKPDRAHHCKYCGRCVLKMDHHCPWVNNCIGFRNYKFFMLFCMYTTLASCYVCVNMLAGLVSMTSGGESLGPVTSETLEICVVFSLMLLCTVVLTGFTGFHIYLTLHNITTIEHIEKRDPSRSMAENPFDVGKRRNWEQVFGSNPYLWFLPVAIVQGDGVNWDTASGISNDSFGGKTLSIDQKI